MTRYMLTVANVVQILGNIYYFMTINDFLFKAVIDPIIKQK